VWKVRAFESEAATFQLTHEGGRPLTTPSRSDLDRSELSNFDKTARHQRSSLSRKRSVRNPKEEQDTDVAEEMAAIIQDHNNNAEALDDAERKLGMQMFHSYDNDGGGSIDVGEMMVLCKHLEDFDVGPTQVIEVMQLISGQEGEPVMNEEHFIGFLSAYKQAVQATFALEPDAVQIFPHGGSAWLYTSKLLARGMMWKVFLNDETLGALSLSLMYLFIPRSLFRTAS
jgi:hypothetical protein